MLLDRRRFCRLGVLSPLLLERATAAGKSEASPSPFGVVIHSFAVRTAADRERSPADRFAEPHRFLAHAQAIGAKGIQVGIGHGDASLSGSLKEQAQAAGMYLEGIVSLPRDEADVERFRAELNTAKQAGVTVVRTVMLSGRRYETFDSAAAFRKFAERSAHSLSLAARATADCGVRLAVENHKDWRADELITILKKHGNDHVGVCLDTGNSISLLEDPMEVIEALAPRAFTTHFKDMAVEEYPDGFLLSEVPLGQGILDLPRAVALIRAANPEIRFNLEMITRDPLRVPCLSARYWETFGTLPGHVLARSMRLVREHRSPRPLRRVSTLAASDQLRAEEENIRGSLQFARDQLRLAVGTQAQ